MTDTVQRFIFEKADIRGEIVHLETSYQTILEQHSYPKQISKLLGESLLAAVLLTSIIKFKGDLTLQLQASGAVNLLVAKCDHEFHVRALCQYDERLLTDEVLVYLGKGKLVVTVQAFDRVKPYQSIIPIENNSITESLETYFAQSEQLSTKLWFAVGEQRIAGMLLQLLPEKAADYERENFWQHAIKLGETIQDDELLTLDNETILHRLYHEEDLRLYEKKPVSFRCTCNQQRMEDAVRTLGREEALELLTNKKVLDVCCEYCNNTFTFDRIDVEKIFHS